MKKPLLKKILIAIAILVVAFLFITHCLQKQLMAVYEKQQSVAVKDRFGQIIATLPNEKGYYAYYAKTLSPIIKDLLIKKEDRFFYYHPGFNPISIIKAGLSRLGIGKRQGSSTISQQLAKNLLGQETKRNLKNKIAEFFYAISIEIYRSKNEILSSYTNSIYFGNQAQGIEEASRLYFGLPPDLLTDGQILQLLASISSPSNTNPSRPKNKELALNLAKTLGLNSQGLELIDSQEVKENIKKHSHFSNSYFELSSSITDSCKTYNLTVDQELTEKLRELVKRNIDELKLENANNAALIAIKLPENELLALIGSPEPTSLEQSYKMNMLEKPRPIGSTVKPFIYLKGFENNLRPYTLVDDREYKYTTAIDLPLYPKNFDLQYRGTVNLHYALSNSLNVPAVKVLEYLGLDNFYQFLENDLGFKPIQDFENYQLGIALGALEVNLLDLAKYFTIFPNNGLLKELILLKNNQCKKGAQTERLEKQIAESQYIQLINKILNDRKTGIEQFGLKSELNLFQESYALKTGTSRDFRDSWIVGYTPDFLIAVWVGNADNTPTLKISGQKGAGRIWQEAMELLLNSGYNKKTPFDFRLLKEFEVNGSIEYGLADDDYKEYRNILLSQDTKLMLLPHQGDVFLLEDDMKIVLEAKQTAKWFIDDKYLGESEHIIFSPEKTGAYTIRAEFSEGLSESAEILILD